MENVMGLITFGRQQAAPVEMSGIRHVAVLPFGGEYRVIDFVLSSMVNSGIENVGVLLQGQYRAVMNHLRSGREWQLAGKRGGLLFLPLRNEGDSDVTGFYHNLDYIEASRQDYILLAGGHLVCSLDYRRVKHFHQLHKADVTLVVGDKGLAEKTAGDTALLLDSDGRVRGLATQGMVSLDMCLMSKSLFLELVSAGCRDGAYDTILDGVLQQTGRLRVYGYRHRGYVAGIGSAQSYYRHHMELLTIEKWQQFFAEAGMTYTCDQEEPPAVYLTGARVRNAIVASGCLIGGVIENSVIFHGVTVEPGAIIKNSIVMPGCHITGDVRLENVICDQDVRISRGNCLKGTGGLAMVVSGAALSQ